MLSLLLSVWILLAFADDSGPPSGIKPFAQLNPPPDTATTGGLLSPGQPGQPGTIGEPGTAPPPFPMPSPTASPGLQQPGQAPPVESLPQGSSCATPGLTSQPGYQCPEPGVLPGSMPPSSNSTIFEGKTNSPTQPGSSGTIPGQAMTPWGNDRPPIVIAPSEPDAFMGPNSGAIRK